MGVASRNKRERRGVNLKLLPCVQGLKKVFHNPDGPKMSESLGDLIDPYCRRGITLDQFRKLVTTGVMAWNLSTIEEPLRCAELDRLVGTIEADGAHDFKDIIHALVARKLSCFPNDNRFIVAFDVSITRGQFHIQAASFLSQSPAKLDALDQQPLLSVQTSDE